jgi:hypothetical protein
VGTSLLFRLAIITWWSEESLFPILAKPSRQLGFKGRAIASSVLEITVATNKNRKRHVFALGCMAGLT